jgi:hypothetical protein
MSAAIRFFLAPARAVGPLRRCLYAPGSIIGYMVQPERDVFVASGARQSALVQSTFHLHLLGHCLKKLRLSQ